MITLHTRVLNGLPVRVEADITTTRLGETEVDAIEIFWAKKRKDGSYNRATVIENKMTENDWDVLRDDILDVACGRWF